MGNVFNGSLIVTTIDLLRFTGVISLQGSSFSGCTSLVECILPPNCETTNGNNTFYGDSNMLVWITPPCFRGFGRYTLYGCLKLQALIFKATTPPTIISTSLSYSTGKIYVPDDYVNAYKEADVWSSRASNIFGHSQLQIDYPDYYEKYITQE